MAKKEIKDTVKKVSKKDLRKEIEVRLEAALLDIKGDIDNEKFKDLIKKAGKLFVTGIFIKSVPTIEVKAKPIKVLKIKKISKVDNIED